jgi:hypothetical protein
MTILSLQQNNSHIGRSPSPLFLGKKDMISVTSVTDRYILQPSLILKHKNTLDWLSAAVMWKREIGFFQKLLDKYAGNFTGTDDKKKIDHFQNLIIYYRGELIDSLTLKLRQHEKKLAEMLETRDETSLEYFKEHDALLSEMDSVNTQVRQMKEELFALIERALKTN